MTYGYFNYLLSLSSLNRKNGKGNNVSINGNLLTSMQLTWGNLHFHCFLFVIPVSVPKTDTGDKLVFPV